MLFIRDTSTTDTSSGERLAEIVIGSLLWDFMDTRYVIRVRTRTGAVSMADFRRGSRSKNSRDNGPYVHGRQTVRDVMARAREEKKRAGARSGSPLRRTNDHLWLLSMEADAKSMVCLTEPDFRSRFARYGHYNALRFHYQVRRFKTSSPFPKDEIEIFVSLCDVIIKNLAEAATLEAFGATVVWKTLFGVGNRKDFEKLRTNSI